MEAALILLEVFPPPLLERPALQTVTALLPHRGRTVSRERALSWYTGMARLTISSALWRSCRRTASFWAGWSGTTERPCTRTVRNMRAVKSGRTVAGFLYVQMPDGSLRPGGAGTAVDTGRTVGRISFRSPPHSCFMTDETVDGKEGALLVCHHIVSAPKSRDE